MRVDTTPGGGFVLTSRPILPEVKQLPEIAKVRSELAAQWRMMRREDPAIARLVRRRMKVATLAAVRQHWGLEDYYEVHG